MRFVVSGSVILTVFALLAGCSCDDSDPAADAGVTPPRADAGDSGGEDLDAWSGADADDGGAGGGDSGGWSSGTHEPVACQGHIYACGDGLDNDGDGLIDSDDPDCLGPCHNSESSFYGSIPGQAGPACAVDCYFDQDSGSGNDDCRWDHRCDPLAVAPAYPPEGDHCAYDADFRINPGRQSCEEARESQSERCLDTCGPLTPNGCDCFGCCELPAGGGRYVWLGSEDASGEGTCDREHLEDPTRCQPCTPVTACLNTCERCELCLGETTLPDDCDVASQCPEGVQACGLPGQAECPADQYCVTGCCQFVVF